MKSQTFIIHIKDNENQSWQGDVEWVQGRRKESFRSMLELLRLVDSVVTENENGDFSGKSFK